MEKIKKIIEKYEGIFEILLGIVLFIIGYRLLRQ